MADSTRSNVFATPVLQAGAIYAPFTLNSYNQIKTGSGVFSGLLVNTAGTTSSVALFDGISAIVTITIAAPGVVSWSGNTLAIGSPVVFQTTGALPTGFTAGTQYFVSSVGYVAGVSFSLADTAAHALAGTNTITTTGSQSGVQTAYDETRPMGTLATTTLGIVNAGINGIAFTQGLIAVLAGGAAANVTVLYN